MHARLNYHVPGFRPLTYTGIGTEFNALVRFFAYLDSEWDHIALRDVTQMVLDGYLQWCRRGQRGAPTSVHYVAHTIGVVNKLALYRQYCSVDRLEILPWGGRSAGSIAGVKKRRENSTPRIPEAVLKPVIWWALFYVQTAAKDILAARRELAGLSVQPTPMHETLERLAAWLALRHSEHRGIPAHDTVHGRSLPHSPMLENVNAYLVCRMAGIGSWHREPDLIQTLHNAVLELGLEPGGMDTPISCNPATGQPWRGRFSPDSLQRESRILTIACYTIIAYFSGMRDSEVSSLKRGCHVTETSSDGLITRHKLHGTTFKHRGPEGTPATWVVIQPVGEAIAVLEQLVDDDYLFWPTRRKNQDAEKGIYVMKRQLKGLCDHINATQQEDGHPPIPDVDGMPWHLTPSQFRRTLAWHIANQPFGVVAGKIQHQHVSVVTFEGYAGQSASGFRSEVEAERHWQQLEDIVERYNEHRQGVHLVGPGADKVTALFQHVQEKLGDFPGTPADPARVRSMLLHVSRTLYPGVLNDCFFDPELALCRKGTKGDTPLFPQCLPSLCPNSCVSERHLVHWQWARADVKQHLKQQRLSPYQRQALQMTDADIDHVIAPLEAAVHASKEADGAPTTTSDGTTTQRESDEN